MIKKPEIVKHKLFKIIGECGDALNMQTFDTSTLEILKAIKSTSVADNEHGEH